VGSSPDGRYFFFIINPRWARHSSFPPARAKIWYVVASFESGGKILGRFFAADTDDATGRRRPLPLTSATHVSVMFSQIRTYRPDQRANLDQGARLAAWPARRSVFPPL
jgi:hypothetical protein